MVCGKTNDVDTHKKTQRKISNIYTGFTNACYKFIKNFQLVN